MENNYPTHTQHYTIDDYQFPDNLDEWQRCPKCRLKPKVWCYDNGRSTACGCWNDQYDHFSIRAESIMSCYINDNKDISNYDHDGLRKNWNEWCINGNIVFESNYSFTGRW